MNRQGRNLLLPLLAGAGLLLAGIKTDLDRSADFRQYKTYSWITGKKTAADPWADRIVKDVDAQLARKGWTRLQSGGDLVVSAFGRTSNYQTLQTYYTDFGGPWKWKGIGDANRSDENIDVGTLVVDLFDGKSKKLVWTGSATEALSAHPDSGVLEQSIEYMFRDFPPTHDE